MQSTATIESMVRSLEEEIVLGRLRPRQRLLEQELAERFDAKRHVVRAALAELEAMEIVERQPNRGAAVKDFSPQEVSQIYDVRGVLEGYAASIMPLPADPAVIARLKAVQEQHAKAIEAQETRAVFRANLEFHRVLFGACGNPFLVDQINQLAARAHGIRFFANNDPKLVARARDEHERMIACMEAGDRAGLSALVAEHIKPSKEAYLRFAGSGWYGAGD